jgi:iron complex outermembrane recepter protein
VIAVFCVETENQFHSDTGAEEPDFQVDGANRHLGEAVVGIQNTLLAILGTLFVSLTAFGQTGINGRIHGTVKLEPSGIAARSAVVTIIELKRSELTDETGAYQFEGIAPGKYQLFAHLDRVPDVIKVVEVKAGDQTVDFQLSLTLVSEQVTVTATGSAEAVGSSYQSVTSVGALELTQRNPISIGEALEYQSGIAKRSFGPGTGRPVIRGFDGDRVLVLQDGLRVGGIASQSADEVEPIDVLSLDRVEIVKGPATLLYGSNAIGGVVNGISTSDVYQEGLSGYLTTFGSTNNWTAGASGGFKYGVRDFLIFGSGGAQKANDYRTPEGTVLNSFARTGSESAGAGWFPRKGWLVFDYSYDRRRHGIPVEPDEIDFESLRERRHSFQVRGGLNQLHGFIENVDIALSYNDYIAREFEFESDENVTELESIATNKNFNYRASFNHRRYGKFSGSFGLSGFTRDYESVGEEAPAPHTKQHSFAVFGLERVDFERIGFQFGGRLEQNGYNPEGNFRRRNFVGFSGSAGLRAPLWTNGSFIANYQHSFRAPALEELYNNGPHPGILVFDIGNPDLNSEQGDGIDLSLRHNTDRVRFEGSVYYYNLRNFVYTAFTGTTDPDSNLPIVNYSQAKSRFVGAEASLESRVAPTLWFNGKVDYVRAELTELNKPLPRIPPLRGTLGLDWRYKSFSFRPEVILVNRQDRVFDNETPTAGHGLFNVNASYAFATRRLAHILSLSGQNLTDKLYRNHLSFIKAIAPEMGRTVRLNYALRF